MKNCHIKKIRKKSKTTIAIEPKNIVNFYFHSQTFDFKRQKMNEKKKKTKMLLEKNFST